MNSPEGTLHAEKVTVDSHRDAEFPEPWLVQYVPSSGKLALDVGAGAGEWTAFLARRFDRVWAFEPDGRADNKAAKGVRWDTRVVGGHVGLLHLMFFSDAWISPPGNTSAVHLRDLDPGMAARGGCISHGDVPMVSIDSLDVAPDFIKVDVEGFEHAVLVGAERTLREHGPVVVVEIHDHKRIGPACASLLVDCGYHMDVVEHPDRKLAQASCYWLAAGKE